jgi:hypothetical protein
VPTDRRRATLFVAPVALSAFLLLVGGCRERALPEIPKGQVARAGGRPERSLTALLPEQSRAGEVFQRLETGEAGLVVLGTGLTRGDTVFWNGRALRTAFAHSRLLTAAVPPQWLEAPGPVEVSIEDALHPSRPKLRAEFFIRRSTSP